MLLRSLNSILIVAFFLLAPFTWSYVGTVSGVLIRAVDVAMLLIIAVTALTGKLSRPVPFIPAALVALIVLLFLRASIYHEIGSAVSATKITYYLVATLCISSIIRLTRPDDLVRASRTAIILLSPLFAYFIMVLIESFGEVGVEGYFGGWNKVFQTNLFGETGALEVQGVAFRNSGGIAFLVAFLFFLRMHGRVTLAGGFLFLLASIMFSRSVWVLQIVFLMLAAISFDWKRKALLLGFGAAALAGIVALPNIGLTVMDRVESDFGRIELYITAFESFEDALLFGRSEGAVLYLGGDEEVVHNVPIAFALKVGILGFVVSSAIAIYIGLTTLRSLRNLTSCDAAQRRGQLVTVVAGLIIFMRPMVSASHEIYFSIGEWGALALFLAGGARCQRRRGSRSFQDMGEGSGTRAV